MAYTVEFAPQALEQLTALYRYIATAASPHIAQRYTDAIVAYCGELHSACPPVYIAIDHPFAFDLTSRLHWI